jgi:hypothetical protein
LYVGKQYTFTLGVSGNYDVHISAKNAKISLIKESLKETGGLRYSVIPQEEGTMLITVSNVIDKNNKISLGSYMYRVIEAPTPSLFLSGQGSNPVISTLNKSVSLSCGYIAAGY